VSSSLNVGALDFNFLLAPPNEAGCGAPKLAPKLKDPVPKPDGETAGAAPAKENAGEPAPPNEADCGAPKLADPKPDEETAVAVPAAHGKVNAGEPAAIETTPLPLFFVAQVFPDKNAFGAQPGAAAAPKPKKVGAIVIVIALSGSLGCRSKAIGALFSVRSRPRSAVDPERVGIFQLKLKLSNIPLTNVVGNTARLKVRSVLVEAVAEDNSEIHL
jgi:hypothetical protein